MRFAQYTIACSLLFLAFSMPAQVVWQPLEDDGLYDFLDELANDQLITLPTVAKPYSRELVCPKAQSSSQHIRKYYPANKKE
jgi:hypothetical protein